MDKHEFKVRGNLVDVVAKRIFKAELKIQNQRIVSVLEVDNVPEVFILPGIIDSHVHIESSMLVPQEFARLAVRHGTVGTVSDPHEIANVLGVGGIDFMINDAKKVAFKFYFGAPSCVPATNFETSGHHVSSEEVGELLDKSEIKYLSEMMNFPGVVYSDEEVLAKLSCAIKHGKPIDGHAPGLTGSDLAKYAAAGITTDHESVSIEEAVEKINLGVKLLIREGSAAKNFEVLAPLIDLYPESVMLCTDDCHPDDLLEKHIIDLIRRGVQKDLNLFNLLRAATYNPIKHYKLDVGLLQINDNADFIIVNNLIDFNVLETYIKGNKVYSNGNCLMNINKIDIVNNFYQNQLSLSDISVENLNKRIKIIVAKDGDLYTKAELGIPKVLDGNLVSDLENDILKIVVVNRYFNAKPIVGFIKNIGLKSGAIAQSVAHDSHNIIATGVSDLLILKAINEVMKNNGGISAVNFDDIFTLSLPIAGLMSNERGEIVAEKYRFINNKAKEWGSPLRSPFMTLSFMALLVIPELKIGDKGLFDGLKFEITSLYTD